MKNKRSRYISIVTIAVAASVVLLISFFPENEFGSQQPAPPGDLPTLPSPSEPELEPEPELEFEPQLEIEQESEPEDISFMVGFWHDAPDFSKGVGIIYEFYPEDGYKDVYIWSKGSNEYSFNIKNGDFYGHWDIRKESQDTMELIIWYGEEREEAQYNTIEYSDQDELTNKPTLLINGQVFYKMNKPVDVINGVPLFINSEESIEFRDYANREVITKNSQKTYGGRFPLPLVIYSEVDLYDIKVVAIDDIEFKNDDLICHFGDTIFSMDKLSKSQYIEYTTGLPEIFPKEAVFLTDGDGKTHVYWLHDDHSYGTNLASKIDPKKAA